MSRSTVTVMITPRVDALINALVRLGRAAVRANRQMKALRRRQRIQAKQARRDQHRANRRPALIHNGSKP